jgi:L-rhamnose-H+ transport protein
MTPNPFLGVLFHWLGGLAAGSFYVPFRAVRDWSWETYWLVAGVFSWIIAPWALGLMMIHPLLPIFEEAFRQHLPSCLWSYFFGALWGIGGLTFGLAMRYLGMSLGMAVALGYCSAFGTLIPPIFDGTFVSNVLGKPSGLVILEGVVLSLLGIAVAGMAGVSKEREMSEAQKMATVKEFNFKKGLLLATFSGVFSACMAFGLAAGGPIKAIALRCGAATLWQGLPVLVIVLAGGFTTNFLWCLFLHSRNSSGRQYFSLPPRETLLLGTGEIGWETGERRGKHSDLLRNYFFSALAGVTWYLQFFFYSMGETQMGKYGFSSWTLHMASIIIFSSLWGIALREWKGASSRTMALLIFGLFLLVLSTVVVGYGNYMSTMGSSFAQ